MLLLESGCLYVVDRGGCVPWVVVSNVCGVCSGSGADVRSNWRPRDEVCSQ